jgi:hypothetical protein
MWFSRKEADFTVTSGEVFRRERPDRVVEEAHVEKIWPDPHGIPHVSFKLQFKRLDGESCDRRTLALERFRDLYRNRVA